MLRDDVERFRSLVEPWARGDFSAWMALLSHDVVLTGYMPEGVVTFEGREAVFNYLADFNSMWTSYRVEAKEVLALGPEAVLVCGRQVGVGNASGVEIAEPVYVVNLLSREVIVGTHWHVDREKALEAAGLSE